MPTHDSGNITDLESIIYVGVERDEACVFDVYQQLIIMPLAGKRSVDGRLFSTRQRGRIGRVIPGINRGGAGIVGSAERSCSQ